MSRLTQEVVFSAPHRLFLKMQGTYWTSACCMICCTATRLILMQRVLHAGRAYLGAYIFAAYAAAYIAAEVPPSFRLILLCAGNALVATLAWIVVGLISSAIV
jgi:hypothetical protein